MISRDKLEPNIYRYSDKKLRKLHEFKMNVKGYKFYREWEETTKSGTTFYCCEYLKKSGSFDMKYTNYVYKLKNGYHIISPERREITKNEYFRYLDISLRWLKVVRPEVYVEIKPFIKDDESLITYIEKMFNGFIYNPEKEGSSTKYFLDKRPLAFIFVLSYIIQNQPQNEIDPDIAHVMGNALLLWEPSYTGLIEYYLSICAKSRNANNLNDCFLLVCLFCPNIGFFNYGFKNNKEKALDYAKILYHSSANKHQLDNYDYAYARALFENDSSKAGECMEIICDKISKYNIEHNNSDTNAILNYLLLGLEIYSKAKDLDKFLDLKSIEKIIEKEPESSLKRNEGFYLLAACYVYGKNNFKDIDKAIELLEQIKNPNIIGKAGALLSSLYLEGNGVELDAREALEIAYLADVQSDVNIGNSPRYNTELSEIIIKAHKKTDEERYVKLAKKLVKKPIHSVNVEAFETLLKSYLTREEYSYIVNKCMYDNMDDNIAITIKEKGIEKEISDVCNRMIYVGTDHTKYEHYLNFDECGNIFIQGSCGSGKTWYLHSIFKRLKDKQTLNKINMAFWSFKPFEFELWALYDLYEDSHKFLNIICDYAKDNSVQTVIFIDEFIDFIESLNEEEKATLKNLFKNSKENNMCFICCSQNMNLALKEYGEYVTTKICMMCDTKEQSELMIGKDFANFIGRFGVMYVLNKKVKIFNNPKLLRVNENNNS